MIKSDAEISLDASAGDKNAVIEQRLNEVKKTIGEKDQNNGEVRL